MNNGTLTPKIQEILSNVWGPPLIPITRIPYSKLFPHPISRKLRLYIGLSEKIEEIEPDLIFLHDVQFLSVVEVANYARKRYVKIYADSHTDFINSGKNWFSKNVLHRIIYKSCVKIIEPYTEMFFGTLPLRVDFLREVYGVPSEKLDLLPFGADATQYKIGDKAKLRKQVREQYSIADEDFLIITGGKIDRRKNINVLMKAVSTIQQQNLKLFMFGSIADDLEIEINLMCKNNSNIIWVGWVSVKKSYELLLASDLGIFPGTHSVIWEQALGVGLPCVFKKWPGIQHLDVGGNCLLLDDPSVEGLTEIMEMLYKDKPLYERMKYVALNNGTSVFSYLKIAKYAIGMAEDSNVSS
jgi:1,2-diacylglycerol 3-alpha-glucosyltransferase